MRKNAKRILLAEAQARVPGQWEAIRAMAQTEMPAPAPRRAPWLRMALPAAALCALIALCLAVGLYPRTLAPPVSTDPTMEQSGMQEQAFSLPSMLGGQKVTWESAHKGDGDVPRVNMEGTLEDGRRVTLGAEEIFHGSKEELAAFQAAHPEVIDFEPSLEVGGTDGYVGSNVGRYPEGQEGDISKIVWECTLWRIYVESIE